MEIIGKAKEDQEEKPGIKRRRGEPWAWTELSSGENQRGGPSSPTKSLTSSKKSNKLFRESGRSSSTFAYGLSTTFATFSSWFFLIRRIPPWVVVDDSSLIAVSLYFEDELCFQQKKPALRNVSLERDDTEERPLMEPSTTVPFIVIISRHSSHFFLKNVVVVHILRNWKAAKNKKKREIVLVLIFNNLMDAWTLYEA